MSPPLQAAWLSLHHPRENRTLSLLLYKRLHWQTRSTTSVRPDSPRSWAEWITIWDIERSLLFEQTFAGTEDNDNQFSWGLGLFLHSLTIGFRCWHFSIWAGEGDLFLSEVMTQEERRNFCLLPSSFLHWAQRKTQWDNGDKWDPDLFAKSLIMSIHKLFLSGFIQPGQPGWHLHM